MRYVFFSPVAFEPWDWRNSVEKGIGGSETSHVEMAWRLARRGHEVVTYAPIPDDCPGHWRGTTWKPIDAADFSESGIWVLYRCPEYVDRFDPARPDQVKWLVCQDYDYQGRWTPQRVANLDRIIPLCHTHLQMLLKSHPEFAGKLWVTRNALKADLVAEVEAEGIPERNPRRIMYASSPDRGLKAGLKIFKRAKEFLPDLEFYATYGFNNLDKLIAQGAPAKYRRDKDECMELVRQTGARFLGRIPQKDLYREWLKTSMLVYCTTFIETGWITGLEAQALGAIPIFSPVGAQLENTQHGIIVHGQPDNEDTIARFAAEVVRLATDEDLQARIRSEMMPQVRADWDWEQFVWKKPDENWEEAAEEDLANKAMGPVIKPGVAGMADNPDEIAARDRWLDLKPGSVMLDVGACDGSWTVPAAKQGAKVFAIDPEAGRTLLQGYLEAAHVRDQVILLASKAGNIAEGNRIVLDSLALEANFDRCDFIKVDVEGEELDVLRGGAALIRRFKPAVMVEVHTDTVPGVKVLPGQVEDFFKALEVGYEFERVPLTYKGKTYFHVLAKVPEAAK